MTIRYSRGTQELTFDVQGGETLTLTRKTTKSFETFAYDSNGCFIIQEELKWLSKNQPGIFRLLYLDLLPHAKILDIFVQLAETQNITL